MHDLVIRGGCLVDGSGAPGRPADVAVVGGTITGSPAATISGRGRRTIDADGLLVTPGLGRRPHPLRRPGDWDPWLTPSSWHGVTTVVMGNCGVGFAPAHPTATSG